VRVAKPLAGFVVSGCDPSSGGMGVTSSTGAVDSVWAEAVLEKPGIRQRRKMNDKFNAMRMETRFIFILTYG
jgi:hypothetical protein